jgi:signal transduction histidine kinase
VSIERGRDDVSILLVDDQPAKLLTYRSILQGIDATLVSAGSAREALEHLLRTDFAVLLIDVIMPELDGFELAAMMREHPRFRKTAIIFVSGIALTELDRLKGYEYGAVDYVSVPVVPEILRAKVGVFVDLHRKTRQLERLNRDLELRVAERTAELQEASRRKDEFLAMLAHELRNPLAAIRLAAQLIGLPDVPAPQRGKSVAVIQRQVEHLVRLIDDLVDVSRITRGLIGLRREILDVPSLVAQAAEATRPTLEARHHTFTTALTDEPLPVEGDTARLAQVLANVLSNAAKFTEPGGRVHLDVRREGAHARIQVTDTGVGIAPDLLPHIFELFTRFDKPVDRSASGLGIGLALVRRLVEMHGGTVVAESEGAGQGTVITVRLPLLAPEKLPPPEIAGDAAEIPQFPPCRILVVDDNEDAAETLAVMLRVSGHDVRTAHDGQQALDVAPGFAPHVVMLDLGMPNLDGYETAARIRASPWGQHLPLLALTGWGQPRDRQRTFEAGFTAHLVKPVDRNEVLNAIRSALHTQ